MAHPKPMEHQLKGLEYTRKEFENAAYKISKAMGYMSSLNKQAFRYQFEQGQEDLDYANELAGVGLFLDMGVGKTWLGRRVAQDLHKWMKSWDINAELKGRANQPVLIVCPNNGKSVWDEQWPLWSEEGDDDVLWVVDTQVSTQYMKYLKRGLVKYVCMSYDTLLARWNEFKDIEWSLVILDEVQATSNNTAARTQCAYQIKALFRIAMSGTPSPNSMEQLYHVLTWVRGYTKGIYSWDGTLIRWQRDSKTWGDMAGFMSMYGDGRNLTHEKADLRACWVHRSRGYDPDHMDNCMALYERMKRNGCMRVLAKDVLDLPPLKFVQVPLELTKSQELAYNMLLRGVMGWVHDGRQYGLRGYINVGSVISQITYAMECCTDLRQLGYSIAAKEMKNDISGSIVDYGGMVSDMFSSLKPGEASSKLEWLENFLSSMTDKVLVFTDFEKTASLLAQDLKDYGVVLYTGKERALLKGNEYNKVEMAEAIRVAQNDDSYRVIIGTKSLYESVTLTAANRVVLYGKVDYAPGKVFNAIRRVWRCGQTKPVTVYNLWSPGTAEVWLNKKIEKKQAMFDAAYDNDKVDLHSNFAITSSQDIIDIFKGVTR